MLTTPYFLFRVEVHIELDSSLSEATQSYLATPILCWLVLPCSILTIISGHSTTVPLRQKADPTSLSLQDVAHVVCKSESAARKLQVSRIAYGSGESQMNVQQPA